MLIGDLFFFILIKAKREAKHLCQFLGNRNLVYKSESRTCVFPIPRDHAHDVMIMGTKETIPLGGKKSWPCKLKHLVHQLTLS